MDSRGSSKDLISSLPDELICHILSFLSTTQAASTSVAPSSCFYKVLALQGNAAQLNLNRFSLRCDLGYLEYLINGWILKVLECGVVDLDLYTSCEFNIHSGDAASAFAKLVSACPSHLLAISPPSVTQHVSEFNISLCSKQKWSGLVPGTCLSHSFVNKPDEVSTFTVSHVSTLTIFHGFTASE
ncbi:hypothetical protein DY000_02000224 [Brassica cretica]|uniref:F-box domain-containing protein n=1 Tax=Brassica cretica TaxID=69181 RepID=A0ABQ7C1Y1_BRACR|nr:hypothetical protein DY000_02000224 [Brassica cretica]